MARKHLNIRHPDLNEISVLLVKNMFVFLSESRWTMLSEEREEDPRRRSSSRSSSPSMASEKEALDKLTTDPAESIPQPTGTEESSRISPEEVSALSRKCPSEEPEVEVPHEEEEETTPPQEVDGLEEVAPKPESKDESGDKSTSDGPTQQSDQVQ